MTELDDADDWDEEWAGEAVGREWQAADGPELPDGRGEVVGREWQAAAAESDDDADRAAAVRTVRLVAAALVLALLGVLAVGLSGSLDGSDDAVGDDPTVLGSGEVVVGPTEGGAIEAYVAERRAALAAVEGTRVAVVSLVAYRPDTAVDELLGSVGAEDLEVLARLVALPGGGATPIDVSVADWLAASRSSLQAERDEIAELLPTIEDPADPFIAGYTEDLARLDAQLAALDPAGELVFGIVVRADPGALRRLAERPEVRLVDVAPDADLGPLDRYRGLRPDEIDLAGTPPVRSG